MESAALNDPECGFVNGVWEYDPFDEIICLKDEVISGLLLAACASRADIVMKLSVALDLSQAGDPDDRSWQIIEGLRSELLSDPPAGTSVLLGASSSLS